MISWANFLVLNLILIGWFCVLQISKSKLSYPMQRAWLLGLPVLATLGLVLSRIGLKQYGIAIQLPAFDVFNTQFGGKSLPDASTFVLSLQTVYWIGFTVFALISMYRLFRITQFFKHKNYTQTRGVKVYETPLRDSFSFFDRIHLYADLDSTERRMVLEHEYLHYQKKHSVDLILLELYHALFWFNPVMFLIKRAMINLHEFEVDEKMYRRYSNEYWKGLLAYSFGSISTHHFLSSRFFNQLTLAKRMKTMKTPKKQNHRLLFIIPAILLIFSLVSWNENTPSTSQNGIEKVDKMPEYKGGKKALFTYLSENIKYPKDSKEELPEGTVHVSFMISKRGAVKEVKVIKSVHPTLDEIAMRVIQDMRRWTPGEKDGKKVKVKFMLPIKFVMK